MASRLEVAEFAIVDDGLQIQIDTSSESRASKLEAHMACSISLSASAPLLFAAY